MYRLICEGACNPRVRQIYLATVGEVARTGLPIHGPILLLQHSLVVTDHIELREDIVACTECGHERRFGNTTKVVPWGAVADPDVQAYLRRRSVRDVEAL